MGVCAELVAWKVGGEGTKRGKLETEMDPIGENGVSIDWCDRFCYSFLLLASFAAATVLSVIYGCMCFLCFCFALLPSITTYDDILYSSLCLLSSSPSIFKLQYI